jgi:hypothetical protein
MVFRLWKPKVQKKRGELFGSPLNPPLARPASHCFAVRLANAKLILMSRLVYSSISLIISEKRRWTSRFALAPNSLCKQDVKSIYTAQELLSVRCRTATAFASAQGKAHASLKTYRVCAMRGVRCASSEDSSVPRLMSRKRCQRSVCSADCPGSRGRRGASVSTSMNEPAV